jgi:polyhydroxyalkanoate synthase
VWRREKAELWRYASDHRFREPPLVIVFSVLGRSYVLDLLPGHSFVETMLGNGLDVFLLDFGVPDHVDAANTFETYVDNYLPRAVRAAAQAAGVEQVDVLGYSGRPRRTRRARGGPTGGVGGCPTSASAP